MDLPQRSEDKTPVIKMVLDDPIFTDSDVKITSQDHALHRSNDSMMIVNSI